MQKVALYFSILFMTILFACNDYNKVLKSPNPEYKYKRAIEYYNAEDYYRALPLLEELIPLYKGTDKGQEIYFDWCNASYHLDQLINAAYHFKKYAQTYPNSKYAEKALFMGAYCNYLDSPQPSLDQTATKMAIEELEVFVNTFPKSNLVDSANKLVDKLQLKLETKEFNNSKQYYTIRKYKSAIVALNNTLQKYPASRYEEEMRLLILKSYYELAIKSIDSKKEERFDKGIEVYYDFIDNFADDERVNEAEQVYAKLVKGKEDYLKEKNKKDEL